MLRGGRTARVAGRREVERAGRTTLLRMPSRPSPLPHRVLPIGCQNGLPFHTVFGTRAFTHVHMCMRQVPVMLAKSRKGASGNDGPEDRSPLQL